MKNQTFRNVAKLFALAAAIALPLLPPSAAHAGSATANMSVSASVQNNCSISAAALSFGNYDPTSASPLDSSAQLTVLCTQGASANIQLGQGANADAGSSDAAPLRRLSDGASNFMSYSLAQDAAYANIWGNTAGTGMGHTGTGASANLTVYGRIAAGQNLPAGNYSDTVVATINF